MFSLHGSFLPTEPLLNTTSYPVSFILATVIHSYLLPLTQLQQLPKQKKWLKEKLYFCCCLVDFSAWISCNLLNRSKETSSGVCRCSASQSVSCDPWDAGCWWTQSRPSGSESLPCLSKHSSRTALLMPGISGVGVPVGSGAGEIPPWPAGSSLWNDKVSRLIILK